MEIVQVVGLGLIATIFVVILKEYRPELAFQVSLAAGLVILLLVLNYIVEAVQVVTDIALGAGLNLVYFQALLRIIGISYLAEFGAQVCRDAGEGSIAAKIEFAAKIIILVVSIPIIMAVIESLVMVIP